MIERSVPFSKPFFSEKDLKEINYKLASAIKSGRLTLGKFVEEFEKSIKDYIGTEHAIAVNSCTAALHTALLALNIKTGDEIIVPANTFVTTANVALFVGAKPVFVDSSPDTFNISPNSISEKVTPKTKAIIVVHLGGNPVDMKEIYEISRDHGLYLIEDAAHALGSRYQRDCCGTLGIMGCFSFYPTKIITTGEGGMVTTDDNKLADRVKMIRNSGRTELGPQPIIELGHNYRMPEISAAIGLSQMRHVKEFLESREKIARIYKSDLEKLRWIKPQLVRLGNKSSYYAFIIRLTKDAPLSRDDLIIKLREKGIGTSILYHPIHLQPLYTSSYGYHKGMLPIAEELGECNLALPMYNMMQLENVEYVVNAIKEIAEEKE